MIEAGRDLGASAFQTFRRVTLPLSVPGLMAASVITILPMAGDYYTNTYLTSGSPKTTMVGNQIEFFLQRSSQPQSGASLVQRSSVWYDDSLQTSMANTLQLALLCMMIATPLGVAMAIGLHRWRGRISNAANGLMLVPIVTPEIVFGVALFYVFSQVYTGFPSGLTRMLLGHITFTPTLAAAFVRWTNKRGRAGPGRTGGFAGLTG